MCSNLLCSVSSTLGNLVVQVLLHYVLVWTTSAWEMPADHAQQTMCRSRCVFDVKEFSLQPPRLVLSAEHPVNWRHWCLLHF
jgi:hypothetical protein